MTENAEAFGASRHRGTSVPTLAAGASSGEDRPTHLGQKQCVCLCGATKPRVPCAWMVLRSNLPEIGGHEG